MIFWIIPKTDELTGLGNLFAYLIFRVELHHQSDFVEQHVPVFGRNFVSVVVNDVLNDPEDLRVYHEGFLVDQYVDEKDALFEVLRILVVLGGLAVNDDPETEVRNVNQVVNAEVYHQLVV